MFVIKDFSALPQRVHWHAVLGGGTIMCETYVISAGRRGNMMTFKNPCRVARKIWASPRFVERHKVLFNIIDHYMQKPCTCWNWFVGTTEEFMAAAGRASKTKPIISLVTPGDKEASQAWSANHANFFETSPTPHPMQPQWH